MSEQVRSETITRRLTAPSLYILSKKNDKRNDNFGVNIFLQGVLIKESDFTPAFEGILSICTWLSEPIKAQFFLQKRQYLLA